MAFKNIPLPKYANITPQVKEFGYGPNLDTDLSWDLLEHKTPEELCEEHTYTLRDNSKKTFLHKIFRKRTPNITIKGRLMKVVSCMEAPRVLVNIDDGIDINRICGRLYGSPNNLGVTLDNVLKIN